MIDNIINSFINENQASGAQISVYTGNPVNNYFSTAGMNYDDNYHTWKKPPNASWVWISAQGGGSSGSYGANTGATTGGGGCGGTSGELKSGLFPAFMLPETLYIQIGQGGTANTPTSGGNSVSGSHTMVTMEPLPRTVVEANTAIILMAAAGQDPTVNPANSTAGDTTLGSPQFVTPVTSNPRMTQGISQSNTAPSNGNSDGGSPGNPGEDLSILATFTGRGVATAGTGGGGTGARGGNNMFASNDTLSRGTLQQYTPQGNPGGAASTGGAPGANGINGAVIKFMWWHYGGTGGGGGSSTAGESPGSGGDGVLGSGGGGCGGTTTVNPSLGTPGRGGDGFVVIMAW